MTDAAFRVTPVRTASQMCSVAADSGLTPWISKQRNKHGETNGNLVSPPVLQISRLSTARQPGWRRPKFLKTTSLCAPVFFFYVFVKAPISTDLPLSIFPPHPSKKSRSTDLGSKTVKIGQNSSFAPVSVQENREIKAISFSERSISDQTTDTPSKQKHCCAPNTPTR